MICFKTFLTQRMSAEFITEMLREYARWLTQTLAKRSETIHANAKKMVFTTACCRTISVPFCFEHRFFNFDAEEAALPSVGQAALRSSMLHAEASSAGPG